MNKAEFLRVLAHELRDLPADERTQALEFYREFLDEAGVENEASAIENLGGPEKAARIIRASCAEPAQEPKAEPVTPDEVFGGNAAAEPQPEPAQTHRAYEYTYPAGDAAQQTQRTQPEASAYYNDESVRRSAAEQAKKNRRIFLIVIAVLTFPFWFAAFAILLGLLIGFSLVAVVLIAVGAVLLVTGLLSLISGFLMLFTSAANGILCIGLSLSCIAAGFLFTAGIISGITALIRSQRRSRSEARAKRAKESEANHV